MVGKCKRISIVATPYSCNEPARLARPIALTHVEGVTICANVNWAE